MKRREFEVAASGLQTGVTAHGLRENDAGYPGLLLVVDATASNGDGTQDLAVRVTVEDPVTGKSVTYTEVTLFTDGAIGTKAVVLYPAITDQAAAPDVEVQDLPVPHDFEIETEVLQGGASPDYTYSIGGVWLP